MLKNMGRIKARELKDNVSIVDFLSRLGYQPVKKIRGEHMYLSMLRDSDNTPSFSVNDRAGCWYDHGDGKGGNVIDFGQLYWKGLTFPEVLEKIAGVMNLEQALTHDELPKTIRQKAKTEPYYQVLKVQALGNNPAIMNYLESRGISKVAEGRLKEIYYYTEDEDRKRKNFFAAGWQNDNGSWEVRNLNYKTCVGHKGISFILGSGSGISIFEGFFDYLSWLTDNPFATDAVLVLNSLALLQLGIDKAREYAKVSLFFDHDKAGRKSTAEFIVEVPFARDCSGVYKGYKDYNDKLIADLNNPQYEHMTIFDRT